MYLPDAEGWQASIMRGTDRQYCYTKAPGQDYFHLIIPGEIYVQKGDEKLCLMCAIRGRRPDDEPVVLAVAGQTNFVTRMSLRITYALEVKEVRHHESYSTHVDGDCCFGLR